MSLNNFVIVLMGVSGSGKTTIGHLLSSKMGIPFFDGDDYHSQQNIDKMKSGLPLNDQDRSGWLQSLNQLIKDQLALKGGIVACSALKQIYRDILSRDIEGQVKFVYLEGTFDKINERHLKRENHFIPSSLLQSQFDILEVPQNALAISILESPEKIVSMIESSFSSKSAIGIVGLGVMGKSLCRNFANNGVAISMYNRHIAGVEENIAIDFKKEFNVLSSAKAFDDIEAFVASLQSPKKILLMVPAGEATDQMIQTLSGLLSNGDIIIDGGNSFYQDTITRQHQLKNKSIHFIGCGISGGEEGALLGPSLMPSGDRDAYNQVKDLLNLIAAKDEDGLPCCNYIGEGGSGHFVKMIHNGIEYAEMQLLSELYLIAKKFGFAQEQFADVLVAWRDEGLSSYLLDITIQILREKEKGSSLLDKIVDVADSKGTGSWATIEMTKEGVPATMLANSLFARHLSSFKAFRVSMSQQLNNNDTSQIEPLNVFQLKEAFQLARIVNHFQGFWFIAEKSQKNNWAIDLSELARIWTNGCIIRSSLMQHLVSILKVNTTILSHPDIIDVIKQNRNALATIVGLSIQQQIAIPCMSDAINFLNGISTEISGANLIQAQRDYFGAHTFQRYDAPEGNSFHHEWKAL